MRINYYFLVYVSGFIIFLGWDFPVWAKYHYEVQLDDSPKGFYMGSPLPDKVAYFTFDDGPSDFTSRILNVLKEEQIKATFFVCANWDKKTTREQNSFKKHKTVLLEMIRDGHVLGNHTANHRNLAFMSREKILKQLQENQELLERELGQSAPLMTLMRPPKGAPWHWRDFYPRWMRKNVAQALENNWIVALWSRHFDSGDAIDWVNGEWYEDGKRLNVETPEFKTKVLRIYKRLISRADGKGIVVLFHDTHPTSWKALKPLIAELKKSGYTFATMEDYVYWRWGKSSQALLNKKGPGAKIAILGQAVNQILRLKHF